MIIQWFPGHMTKALRMMEKEIKIVDSIIYVLDARAPFSCLNPKFSKVIGNKPFIYVLNKCDMADPAATKEWQAYFSKLGSACILLNSTQSGAGKKLITELNVILKDKIERNKNKNINTIIRTMVLGVPNSGKSTLINNLVGKAKTITGDRPGVTRIKQWVRIGNYLEVLDTPGTLWPAFDNNLVAQHLAYIGSIKEEVLDIPTLSLSFIEELCKAPENILKKRYNIDYSFDNTPLEILEKICISRGAILKKNELDYNKGAQILINDFKAGRLGQLSLERVADINNLLIKDRTVLEKDE